MDSRTDTTGQARFQLDEARARAFLHRALRRRAGDLDDREGGGKWEDWALEPGWNLAGRLSTDEVPHVEDLVYQAIEEAGAISCPAGTGIDLLIDARDGDRMYQWRVTFPVAAGFALCSPLRLDVKHLGADHGGTRGKGCRTALDILRDTVGEGNKILDAYAQAAGRIPADGSDTEAGTDEDVTQMRGSER
jgi:hypothetical protein